MNEQEQAPPATAPPAPARVAGPSNAELAEQVTAEPGAESDTPTLDLASAGLAVCEPSDAPTDVPPQAPLDKAGRQSIEDAAGSEPSLVEIGENAELGPGGVGYNGTRHEAKARYDADGEKIGEKDENTEAFSEGSFESSYGFRVRFWTTPVKRGDPGITDDSRITVSLRAEASAGYEGAMEASMGKEDNTADLLGDTDYGLWDALEDGFWDLLSMPKANQEERKDVGKDSASASGEVEVFLETHKVIPKAALPAYESAVTGEDVNALSEGFGGVLGSLMNANLVAEAAAGAMSTENLSIGQMVRMGASISAEAAIGSEYRALMGEGAAQGGAMAATSAIRLSEDAWEVIKEFEGELEIDGAVGVALGIAQPGFAGTMGWKTGLKASFIFDADTIGGPGGEVAHCLTVEGLEELMSAYSSCLNWSETLSERSESLKGTIARDGFELSQSFYDQDTSERIRHGNDFEAELSGTNRNGLTLAHEGDTILGSERETSLEMEIDEGKASGKLTRKDTVSYPWPGIPSFADLAKLKLSKALKGVLLQEYSRLLSFKFSQADIVETMKRAHHPAEWEACARSVASAGLWVDTGDKIRAAVAPEAWTKGEDATPQLALLAVQMGHLTAFASWSPDSDTVFYNLLQKFGELGDEEGAMAEEGLGSMAAIPGLETRLEEVQQELEALPGHLDNFDKLNDPRAGVAAVHAILSLIDEVRAEVEAGDAYHARWMIWAIEDLETARAEALDAQAEFMRKYGVSEAGTRAQAISDKALLDSKAEGTVRTIEGFQRLEAKLLDRSVGGDTQDQLRLLGEALGTLYRAWVTADNRLSDAGQPIHALPDFEALEQRWKDFERFANAESPRAVFPIIYNNWPNQ